MKKRLTALLLLVCMLLTMVPMGAWAEEEETDVVVHSENEDNESECSHDWVKETCTTEKCTKCQATRNATTPSHTWSNWTSNGETHTRSCTASGCNATESKSHNYSSWTASGDKHVKTCTDCSEEVFADHNWGTKWVPNGNGTHSRVCADCGAKKDTEPCVPDTTATCAQAAKCKDCGGDIGSKTDTHSSLTYISNGDGTHTVKCTVCGYSAKEDCTGDATCKTNGTCELCGAKYLSKQHTKAAHPRQIGTEPKHEEYCSECGIALSSPIDCSTVAVSNKNGTHNLVCTECGATTVANLPCSYDPNTAKCSQKPTCKDCHEEYGEVLGHDRDGDGPCKRPSCDCTHQHVTAAVCTDCGKALDEYRLNVTFTITGFGIGKPVNGIGATSSDSHVKVTKVTASPKTKAADDTFQAGTTYDVTITYSVDPGYVLQNATINGQPHELDVDGNSVSATLGTPAQLYTITYAHKGMDDKDIQGVTFSSTLPTEYTAASLPLSLPTGTRTGYTFKGWTGTGVKDGKIVSGTTGNLTITANWEKLTYTVKFLKNSGDTTSYAEYTVKYGEKCPTPKVPTADDQVFDCWKKDGAKYDLSKAVTGDMTLIASWKDAGYIKFHNCSYGTRTYAVGSKVNLSKDIKKPVKNGYYFCGWYSDSALKKVSSSTITIKTKGEVIHVYAKWKKMDTTNPKTGDTARPELALGILAASGICLGAATVLSKKKRRF